ncbi:MAG: methyltransferase [Candidatus Cloacimonadia bacterium]|jgi:tRNA1Val (adenine37-N6)-methyltransferase
MKLRPVKLPFDGVTIHQNIESQAVSTDTEMLYNAVKEEYLDRIKESKRVLELGTGNGVLAIMLALTFKKWDITALEVQIPMYKLAVENAKAAGVEVDLRLGDLKRFPEPDEDAKYDVILSNPPYFKLGNGRISNNLSKLIARYEILCTMEDVLSLLQRALNEKGKGFVLYPVSRAEEIEYWCQNKGLLVEKVIACETNNSSKSVAIYVIKKS